MEQIQERSTATLLKLLEAEACRRDFWTFCLYTDPEFYTKRPFLRKVAEAFQRVADRKIMRLHVSMPPRAGKSRTATLFCAWLLGKYPHGSIMRNTVTARLYNKFSYDTREVMLSDSYQEVFPHIELAPDKQSVEGWSTTEARQVSYFGAGVGGTIIGFGATLVSMTDDLYKSIEDALSDTVQDKTWSWYTGSHMSRQEKECPVIDIGTRWCEEDVIGRNLKEDYYQESVVISALNADGTSFCEDVKTTEEYNFIKRKTDDMIWEAEYMQSPITARGLMWSRKELNRFSLIDLMRILKEAKEDKTNVWVEEGKMGYIDVADDGEDALSFPTALIVDHPDGPRCYIVSWVFTTENVRYTKPLVVAEINKWLHEYVRFESNNQGGTFFKMVEDDDELTDQVTLQKIANVTNKHTRILMQQGVVQSSFYFLCDEEIPHGSQYEKAFDQMCTYPKVGRKKKVDAPDSIAGLSKMVTSILSHLFN